MAYIAHDQSVNQIVLDSHSDVTVPKLPSVDKTLTTVFEKMEDYMAFKIKTVIYVEVLDMEETSSNDNFLRKANH